LKDNLVFTCVQDFKPDLQTSFPETHALLTTANLVVHPLVSQIILHGSRGLAGGCRRNSDVDLSLIADLPESQISESQCYDIARTTLHHWHSSIEVDLAVIFDRKKCGLMCFEQTTWKEEFCQLGGVDCFGIYKIQKGFNGFITNAGIQVRWMVPCLKIWQRREGNP
jgi:hypothetical protein